jgi:hypothetical protein
MAWIETQFQVHVSSDLQSTSHMKIIMKIGAMFIQYALSSTSFLYL